MAAAAVGEGEVRRDMWGQEYRTSSAECAAALDAYYAAFLSFGRGRVAAVLRAAAADPTCALAAAHAAQAIAPRDPAGAAAFLAAAADNLGNATEYERAVFGTLSAMVAEERNEEVALERHFELLKKFPRDLLSLKRAQLICFYSGKPDLSLKFVEQVLPENQDQNYIYGMLAFPLLELGKMAEAERAARKGLAINKNDVWSQHNKVLDVYDRNIMKELEKSDCEAAEVYLNALGLLLRLFVRGHVDHAKERVSSMEQNRQQVMQKAVQLAEAVYEFGNGEHKEVFDTLGPDFDALCYKMIGASDEQVDVFNEVWFTVLINAGETSKAIDVLGKQIRKREGAPFLWRLLGKAYSLDGRDAEASVAYEKANALQAAYSY
ncbi:tetratricopeptide repeat protein 38 [Panicum miliaceum]|uniref:Tetratricopeptide repeat protein 38 n=1 Tax=Panicum miliaceum TaxID=4540 RepID=A0A3L6SCN8_PANMI|nr:tetratricopeptide repeat protein 38 [Panicum miliaceum]